MEQSTLAPSTQPQSAARPIAGRDEPTLRQDMPARRRILLTYGWCRTAYVAAESLARRGHHVFACDDSPFAMTRCSRHVRKHFRTPNPFSKPIEYVEALAEIVARKSIDILFPVHEDALPIQRERHRLPNGLIVAAPSFERFEHAVDKLRIIRTAERAGVDAPRTLAPKDLADASASLAQERFPLIIKTRRGNSGKGVFFIHSAAEGERVYREVVERYQLRSDELPLLQEVAAGEVYGCCFLADRGKILGSFAERYVRCKGGGFGTSVYREPCDWPLLHEHAAKMAAALDWTGLGHFDFIGGPNRSRARLIEMNPRLWGAVNLAVRNGYDFPAAYVELLTTGEVAPSSLRRAGGDVASLWILGELIAGVAELKDKSFLAPLQSLGRILRPGPRCAYDDFRWSDPLPFFAEALHYAWQFIAAGGETNPDNVEMMRS